MFFFKFLCESPNAHAKHFTLNRDQNMCTDYDRTLDWQELVVLVSDVIIILCFTKSSLLQLKGKRYAMTSN